LERGIPTACEPFSLNLPSQRLFSSLGTEDFYDDFMLNLNSDGLIWALLGA